jgi:hypothetical protein
MLAGAAVLAVVLASVAKRGAYVEGEFDYDSCTIKL